MIWHITIKNYIEEVIISQKRRAVYWKESDADKLPKRYSADKGFKFLDSILVDANEEKVIRNKKTFGQPRYAKINFQNIYNGSIANHARAKLVDELHKYYANVFRDAINRGDIPQKIELSENERLIVYFEFNNVYTSKSQDVDNHCHLHIKTSLDVLTTKKHLNQKDEHKLGVIPDDTRRYIKGIYYDITDVPTEEDKCLKISIAVVNEDFKLSTVL